MNVLQHESIGMLKNGEVFEWNIPGYVLKHKYSAKRSNFFTHSRMTDCQFCLTLHPYSNNSEKWVSFNLQLHRIPLLYCGSYHSSESSNHFVPEMDVRFLLYKSNVIYKWSCSMRMQDNRVTADFPHVATYDSLTIQCIMMPSFSNPIAEECQSQDVSKSSQSTTKDLSEEFHTLALDMSSLLKSGNLSDVTLCVEDKEFNVHRCILASRSNVFAAMFNHDTRENREKRIVIEDFSNDVIYQILKYIYTDQIDELTFDQYLFLYSAADKYAIMDLRNKCSQQLKKHLPLKSVIHVLVTADLHQDGDLLDVARQMFLNNAVTVMSSEEWLPFMQNHTQLASKILMHLAKRSSK